MKHVGVILIAIILAASAGQSVASPLAQAPQEAPDVGPVSDEDRLDQIVSLLEDSVGAGTAGLAGLRMLQSQAPNGTNETILAGNHNGTVTHTHGQEGDLGLGAVWAVPFYGNPLHSLALDFNGDGTPDGVIGTDVAIVGVDGATGSIRWARLIGNEVTSIFPYTDNGKLEIGFTTLWQAQLAQVGVIDAVDGTERWVEKLEEPLLGGAASGDGGIVATSLLGNHYRFDGRTGAIAWDLHVELLDDQGPEGTVYTEYGHYLTTFADLDGDGVTDSVSAGLYRYYVPIAVDNTFTIIHAVSGATGDKLWISAISPEPPVLGVAVHVLSDLDHLDVQGDGSMDISYTGWSFRWPLLWSILVINLAALAFISYETYVRAVDGSSDTVGVILGGRTLVTPVLDVLESYAQLDHLDLDDDGKDEVAVIRSDIVTSTLNQNEAQLEFYRFPASAANGPADLYVSPITYLYNGTAVLQGSDTAAGRMLVANVQEFAAGTVQVIGPDGMAVQQFWLPDVPRAGAIADGTLVSAQVGFVRVGPVDALPRHQANLRGSVIDAGFEDYDRDGFDDIWALSDDGNLHVIDALTGDFLTVIDLELPVERIWFADVVGSAQKELFIVRQNGEWETAIEMWSIGSMSRQWARPYNMGGEPALFDADGDGVRDIMTYDPPTRSMVAINAVDGAPLWGNSEAFVLDEPRAWRVDYTEGSGEDVVVEGWNELIAMDGANGATLWERSTSFREVGCATGADLSGSGRESFVLIMQDSFRDVIQLRIDSRGVERTISLLPGATWVGDCQLTPVADGARDDLLVKGTFRAEESVSGFSKWSNGTAWTTFSNDFFTTFGTERTLGVVPGEDRFYFSKEDHVYGASWATGRVEGEFVVNGPYVVSGAVVNLDRSGPSEVMAYSADGLFWALSETPDEVREALNNEALAAGKIEEPDEVDDVKPASSDGAPFVLIGGIAAGVALLLAAVLVTLRLKKR